MDFGAFTHEQKVKEQQEADFFEDKDDIFNFKAVDSLAKIKEQKAKEAKQEYSITQQITENDRPTG